MWSCLVINQRAAAHPAYVLDIVFLIQLAASSGSFKWPLPDFLSKEALQASQFVRKELEERDSFTSSDVSSKEGLSLKRKESRANSIPVVCPEQSLFCSTEVPGPWHFHFLIVGSELLTWDWAAGVFRFKRSRAFLLLKFQWNLYAVRPETIFFFQGKVGGWNCCVGGYKAKGEDKGIKNLCEKAQLARLHISSALSSVYLEGDNTK